MPISKAAFDEGHNEDPMIDKIQALLDSDKNKAFTENEILKQLYPEHIAWPGDRISFISTASFLAHAKKIETKYVTSGAGHELYFRAK